MAASRLPDLAWDSCHHEKIRKFIYFFKRYSRKTSYSHVFVLLIQVIALGVFFAFTSYLSYAHCGRIEITMMPQMAFSAYLKNCTSTNSCKRTDDGLTCRCVDSSGSSVNMKIFIDGAVNSTNILRFPRSESTDDVARFLDELSSFGERKTRKEENVPMYHGPE